MYLFYNDIYNVLFNMKWTNYDMAST